MSYRLLRFSLGLVLVCLTASFAVAGDTSICNFREDFEGGPAFPWVLTGEGSVTYVNGVAQLEIDGVGATLGPSAYALLTSTICVYSDFVVEARIRDLTNSVNKVVSVKTAPSSSFGYQVNLRSSPLNDVVITRATMSSPAPQILGTAPFMNSSDTWYNVRVTSTAGEISVAIDGIEVLTVWDPTPLPAGSVGLAVNAGAADLYGLIECDQFTVSPTGAVPTESKTWGAVKELFGADGR